MTEQPKKHFKVPEDTVYLLLGILRLERDGVKNPASNIDTALKELKDCCQSRPVSTLPEGAAPELEWKPSPPGDTISDIMEERGISRFKLGCLLKLREQSVSDLLSGNCPIDNDMAFRLSEVLGSTPDFWDNREQIYRRELRESTNDYHDAAIRKDEREKVLEELHVALHTIPIMLVGPGVIFAPTINYIDAVVIRSLRQPKQKKEVPK